jgi:carbamoyl-phosphate synthase large subunit
VTARLLILEAGSSLSGNLIRSLRTGDPSLFIVGCNDCAFFLNKSEADRNYVLPFFAEDFAATLRRIVETERIDLIIPTTDADVLRLSEARDEVGSRTFLPSRKMLEQCQDKYALSVFLRERGIPAPLTYEIATADGIAEVFQRFENATQLWCRIRTGSGSVGAIPVITSEQVRSWIAYWDEMRGVPAQYFTLSEYLPGRDYCVQCLWENGRLVLAKMAERLTYLQSGSPSGVSSMPALAKTVYDPNVVETCARAIRALDSEASGVYFVDLKENADGTACITEINAGRFATMTNIHDLTGAYNMAVLWVRLGMGAKVEIPNASDFDGDYYLVRAMDTVPLVVRAEDVQQRLTEIQDDRSWLT